MRACVGNQWGGYPPVGRIFILNKVGVSFQTKQKHETSQFKFQPNSKILSRTKIPPATANAELLWVVAGSEWKYNLKLLHGSRVWKLLKCSGLGGGLLHIVKQS